MAQKKSKTIFEMQVKVIRSITPYEFVGLVEETNALLRFRTRQRICSNKITSSPIVNIVQCVWDCANKKIVCQQLGGDIFVL